MRDLRILGSNKGPSAVPSSAVGEKSYLRLRSICCKELRNERGNNREELTSSVMLFSVSESELALIPKVARCFAKSGSSFASLQM